MASASRPTNPFYFVLLAVGMLFAITACSYFVMTLQGRSMSLGRSEAAGNQEFVEFVDRYGFTALMIELGLLAAATFAAMATDEYWTRKAAREENSPGEAQSRTEADEVEGEAHESEPLRSD